ncbi:nucleoside phosphorylase-I family protein [Defluviitalea phaphyphila]|uniref:hypothetical protein n=1 Tax=Defluviitalea phaphyphila TaxID=1473580 RepID=UPI0007304A85|nr:hypothetical protein [Defluviitalea phaphyphila]
MVYFLTALYYEAKEIIKHYKMKKVIEAKKFQIFKNDKYYLIITGTGGIKAAVGATYLLSNFGYNENDIFINIGICGANKEKAHIGEIFLCNKLINKYTKKSYYPDMLFSHSFREGSLESFLEIVDKDMIKNVKADIVDQEGAFLYEAVSIFLKPENIYIIKIVSDFLEADSVTPVLIENLMASNLPKVYEWIDKRLNIEDYKNDIMNKEENDMINILCKNMKLSSAMEYEFKKLSKQYKIRNGQILDLLIKYKDVKCNIKAEGKKVYGELKQKLMEL